jgi:hypothetical protein
MNTRAQRAAADRAAAAFATADDDSPTDLGGAILVLAGALKENAAASVKRGEATDRLATSVGKLQPAAEAIGEMAKGFADTGQFLSRNRLKIFTPIVLMVMASVSPQAAEAIGALAAVFGVR